MTGELRPQTVKEALQLPDPVHRLFLAVHEIGHVVAGMATGNRNADGCELTLGTADRSDGSATADLATVAYPDLTWADTTVLLTSLHGGLLAQLRWLHEQELWSARRARAVRDGAQHDREAIRELRLHWRESAKARERAQVLLAENWSGLLVAAERLTEAGHISGAEVRAALAPR